MSSASALGFGIGLRAAHYAAIEEGLARGASADGPLAALDWFEAISENYFAPGGNPRRMLRAVRERFPVVLHGVALSIGSVDALDEGYLDRLAALAAEIDPALDLGSPVLERGRRPVRPRSAAAAVHRGGPGATSASGVQQVQDRLRRPILLENVSSYVQFVSSALSEWEFLSALCHRTGCGLLLDVNNVFVSAHNHGFDAERFIRGRPRRPGRADPPGGAQHQRLAAARHPRPPRARGGLGPLPAGRWGPTARCRP